MHEMDDVTSLAIKKEFVAFDTFVTNLQGEAKKHVEALMSQLGAAEDLLEVKGKIEREDSLTIASLNVSLEEESEYRTTLEERLESLDDKNDEIIAKIMWLKRRKPNLWLLMLDFLRIWRNLTRLTRPWKVLTLF